MNRNQVATNLANVVLLGLLLAGCSPEQSASAGESTNPETPGAETRLAETGDARSREAGADGTGTEGGSSPEVIVLSSDEFIPFLESEDWWGEVGDEQLQVPHVLIAGINPSWQVNAQNLPVEVKKGLFYRLMLPLVMHANQMVRERRSRLQQAREELAADSGVSPESLEFLQRVARVIPGMTPERIEALRADDPGLGDLIDDLLYRVDVVPPGLALGQAAYESGYGTSRFAVEGNSLFGQWTYGGDGIVPGQQRKSKGDHRIKAFDWPFDSVRGYFINLMSHRAYEDFRRLRADLRAAGKPMDSLTLADGLLKYSERGQDYVDSLKGMIRHNKLDVADDAVLRDEPVRFVIGGGDAGGKAELQAEIDRLRESGELSEIVDRMQLD